MEIKPILMNTEMVRAILDRRKTCTRRVVKPQPINSREYGLQWKGIYGELKLPSSIESYAYSFGSYAPYLPGDILYVRETWHRYAKLIGKGGGCHLEERYGYKASIANSEDAAEPWKPSIHMPKEAARIWLKVTEVRVERLKDITADGIRNEGLSSMAVHAGDMEIALKEWENLWNSTIKKSDIDRYGWNANPWVWVIEFERCEKPQEVNDND